MNIYSQNSRVKIGLLLSGLFLVCTLLVYSNWVVNNLRDDNRRIVSMYSELIAKTLNDDSNSNLGFIFNEVIQKVQFPIIYSDRNNEPNYYKNLSNDLSKNDLIKIIKSMDKLNKPIPITFNNGKDEIILGYLHYGESSIILSLKWLPYFEIGIISLFIIFGLLSFNSIRRIEKSNIWNGMAKETAHQLGTPVSALMGWVQRIKDHPDESESLACEMGIDIERLSQISDRFSKIGSNPKLTKVSLNKIIISNIDYIKKRLPFSDNNLKITINEKNQSMVYGDETLLGWAIENLIKNSIDSIDKDKRVIKIDIFNKAKDEIISIKDNGRGIDKKDWNNIFEPGFTTKKRGWGIGLSLVRRIIVDLHKGNVKVINSSKQHGTTFQIKVKNN